MTVRGFSRVTKPKTGKQPPARAASLRLFFLGAKKSDEQQAAGYFFLGIFFGIFSARDFFWTGIFSGHFFPTFRAPDRPGAGGVPPPGGYHTSIGPPFWGGPSLRGVFTSASLCASVRARDPFQRTFSWLEIVPCNFPRFFCFFFSNKKESRRDLESRPFLFTF